MAVTKHGSGPIFGTAVAHSFWFMITSFPHPLKMMSPHPFKMMSPHLIMMTSPHLIMMMSPHPLMMSPHPLMMISPHPPYDDDDNSEHCFMLYLLVWHSRSWQGSCHKISLWPQESSSQCSEGGWAQLSPCLLKMCTTQTRWVWETAVCECVFVS